MSKRKWFLNAVLLLGLPFALGRVEALGDVPYLWLTGYSHHELEELSYLDAKRLQARTGLPEVPGGFDRDRSYRGRAAHAIASYLGTRRWGPDITLAFGYLKEYLPALVQRGEADPADIAANYAGVTYALREEGRLRNE
ncbi:MAG: hypothetical protein ACRD21_10500 [Vicinamibacteria bacterium]